MHSQALFPMTPAGTVDGAFPSAPFDGDSHLDRPVALVTQPVGQRFSSKISARRLCFRRSFSAVLINHQSTMP